jgi:hypothetical protein
MSVATSVVLWVLLVAREDRVPEIPKLTNTSNENANDSTHKQNNTTDGRPNNGHVERFHLAPSCGRLIAIACSETYPSNSSFTTACCCSGEEGRARMVAVCIMLTPALVGIAVDSVWQLPEPSLAP